MSGVVAGGLMDEEEDVDDEAVVTVEAEEVDDIEAVGAVGVEEPIADELFMGDVVSNEAVAPDNAVGGVANRERFGEKLV